MKLRFLSMLPFIKNILPILGRWYQTGTSKSTKLFGTGTDFRNVTS